LVGNLPQKNPIGQQPLFSSLSFESNGNCRWVINWHPTVILKHRKCLPSLHGDQVNYKLILIGKQLSKYLNFTEKEFSLEIYRIERKQANAQGAVRPLF